MTRKPIGTNTSEPDSTKHISMVMPIIEEPEPMVEHTIKGIDYANKDRSHGNAKHLRPVQKGEIRNPKGNPDIINHTNMRKIKAMYAKEGFSSIDVAKRMTGWLNMPYGKAKKAMNDDKTKLFERLGISILVHATETGDTSRLDKILDRVIGTVVQQSSTDIRSLSVTAKADGDLLTRIRNDMVAGRVIDHNDITKG